MLRSPSPLVSTAAVAARPQVPFASFSQKLPLSTPISISSSNPRLALPFSPFRLPLRFRRAATANRDDLGDSTAADSVGNGDVRLDKEMGEERGESELGVGIGTPRLPTSFWSYKMSLGDQAFFLLTFIACTTSIAFASLIVAVVPTLHAMKQTAISLAKLADTAREELPGTMAAIRLSGMEISDLTLELSDLSQEIADGVTKSAQAMQAAEAGIRQIGALARQRTMTMIEERANLPPISLQPVVAGAARKTSNAVGEARKALMNIFSRGESDSETLADSGKSTKS